MSERTRGPLTEVRRFFRRLLYEPTCWRRGHDWRARFKTPRRTPEGGLHSDAEVWWCTRCKKRHWPEGRPPT